jgi:hypothetical protein
VAAQRLRADVRLTTFGPQGRLRGRAEVWLERPDHLRYSLIGPQGGPLVVLACDGTTLQGLDLTARRFVAGPATPAAFDAWLGSLPAHLDAATWVRLLLGELEVPMEAVPADGAAADQQALTWQTHAGAQMWAAFTRSDGQLQAWRMGPPQQAATLEVAIRARGAGGVPTHLLVQHHGDPHFEADLRLTDVQLDVPMAPQTFSLAPPAGMPVEQLDPIQGAGEAP